MKKSELRVAIVGAGPAGIFTAEELLRGPLPLRIDFFERWHDIGGLVRYGVAPDHPHTKRVLALMEKTCAHERVRIHTDVEVLERPSASDLLKEYDALVIATGAVKDRRLGVPGETLGNVIPSQRFAGWLNGRPDCSDVRITGEVESVAIIGNGNVALDAARMLCRSADELRTLALSPSVCAALEKSRPKRIYVIGRRGPAQTAFTENELLELLSMPQVRVTISERDLQLTATDELELARPEGERYRAVFNLLRQTAKSPNPARPTTEIHFLFYRLPQAMTGDHSVRQLLLRRCRLVGPPFAQVCMAFDEYEVIDADLVITAIGHECMPLPGLPFDEQSRRIPHRNGRVMPRVYAAGWISRPATGLIGHNRRDAIAVAKAIFEDCRDD